MIEQEKRRAEVDASVKRESRTLTISCVVAFIGGGAGFLLLSMMFGYLFRHGLL